MNLQDAIRDFQLVPPIDPTVTAGRTMAERPGDLRGLRLGLLDNRKGNANVLIDEIGGVLQRDHGAASADLMVKPIFSRPAPAELLEALAGYDAVITAIGD